MEDHPRLRGEQSRTVEAYDLNQGSPPLARGTDTARGDLCAAAGITPACAGNSYLDYLAGGGGGDHPRLRGEQPTKTECAASHGGSPPLARGTVSGIPPDRRAERITPACAGNRLFAATLYLC